MRKLLLATTALIAFSSAAMADNVTFNSNGTFSSVSGCTSNCSVSNGGNTLNMSGLLGQSTLNANDVSSTTFSTPQNDFILGSVTWQNLATFGTDQSFNANYALTLNFTAPNSSSGSQTFNMNILQNTNPQGDNVIGISNASLAGYSGINLNGIIISDLHWEIDGVNLNSSYDGSNWFLKEGHTAQLDLVADFVAGGGTGVGAVPEASTWAMMLLGFLGVGAMGMRKKFGSLRLA